jgi:CBS domain-containing protein
MAMVRDVMTPNPTSLEASASLREAARAMKEANVGAVVVTRGEQIVGIVTDRDLVVRGMAEEKDPDRTRLEQIHSTDLTVVEPLHSVEQAAQIMAENSVQRLPVVAEGIAVGIISVADLAAHLEPDSALTSIAGSNAKR